MVRFISFSDECENQKNPKIFACGGWWAPANVWDPKFTERWETEVLNGPPQLEYFHSSSINDIDWRRKNGVADADAERRIDAAASIIESFGWLKPVCIYVKSDIYARTAKLIEDDLRRSGARFLGVPEKKVPLDPKWRSLLRNPDFYCFLVYCVEVLDQVAAFPKIGSTHSVEFVLEQKNEVSKWIDLAYEAAGRESTEALKAGITVVSKDSRRRPLEAADMLCWYIQKHHGKTLGTGRGLERFNKLRRREGVYKELTEEHLLTAAARFSRRPSDLA